MDLSTIITFLKSIYDDAASHNLTRLQHEALREAIRRLSELVQQDADYTRTCASPVSKAPKGRPLLRLLNGQKNVPPRER